MDYFRKYENNFGTAKEACRAYNIHPSTLLRWARDGKVRYRVGLGGKNREYEIVTPDILNEPSKTSANV